MNSLFGGSIVPCVHHRWLLGCGLATVAVIHSAGKQVTPDRLSGPRVELGFRVGVEYAISAHLRAQLSSDFVAATARQGVKIDGQMMWDPSPLSVLPALRLLALF